MAVVKSAAWVGRELANGRYLIRAALGEGGMGTVYRAWDRNLETEVVIKVPRLAMLEDPGFAERFSREIRSLVKLTHPHIVKVLDVGSQDGVPFAVMQYLAGGSLETHRRELADERGRCPAASLAGWLPEIAQALDFLHAQGYLHRDVKPANILFDEHKNAYLSDFGIIKALAEAEQDVRTASLTGTGMVLGTPHYMAPEMVTGEPIDGRADQYALAVVAYELLAGRYPIDGPTPTAVLVAQTTQTPIPLSQHLPGLDPGLAEAVMRGLAKPSGKRFGRCGELAQAVAAGIESRGGPRPEPAAKDPLSGVAATAPGGRRSVIVPGGTPCPVCRAKLGLEPSHAGKRLRCRSCQARLAVSADFRELVVREEPSRSPAGVEGQRDTDGYRIGAATQELTPLEPARVVAPPPQPPAAAPAARIITRPVTSRRQPPLAVIGVAGLVLVLVAWGAAALWFSGAGSGAGDPSVLRSVVPYPSPAPSETPASAGAAAPLSPFPAAGAGAAGLAAQERAGEPGPEDRAADTDTRERSKAAGEEPPGVPPATTFASPATLPAQPVSVALLTSEQRERIRRAVGILTVRKAEGVREQAACILLETPRALATRFLSVVGAQSIEVEWGDGTREPVSGYYHCAPRLNLALLAVDGSGGGADRGVPLAAAPPPAGERLLALDGRFAVDEVEAGVRVMDPLTPERMGAILAALAGSPWGERAFDREAPWMLREPRADATRAAAGWFNAAGEVVGLVWPVASVPASQPQVALALPPCIPAGEAWNQPRPLDDLPRVRLLGGEYLTPAEPVGKVVLGEEELDLRDLIPRDLEAVRERLADAVDDEGLVVRLAGENGTTAAYFSYANDAKGLSRLEGDSLLLDEAERPLLLCQYKRAQRDGLLVLCREEGRVWMAQQFDRGKRHGWGVLFREGVPWVFRKYRYGSEEATWVQAEGWLATVATAAESGLLLSAEEQEDLMKSGQRADESAEELSKLIFDSFQDVLKNAVRDRARQGQVQARADSRARAAAMDKLRARIGADYEDAKRRALNGGGS